MKEIGSMVLGFNAEVSLYRSSGNYIGHSQLALSTTRLGIVPVGWPFDGPLIPIKVPNPVCHAACDITFTAAAAACTGITNGLGATACMIGAEAARNECRNRC